MNKLSSLKIIAILAVILCIYFSASIFADKKDSNELDNSTEEYMISLKNCYFPEEGMVPDAETAKKIAIAVWLPIYGEGIYNKFPLRAKLVGDSLWFVCGTIIQPTDGSIIVGGVPYAKIRKSDGEIICIIHDK